MLEKQFYQSKWNSHTYTGRKVEKNLQSAVCIMFLFCVKLHYQQLLKTSVQKQTKWGFQLGDFYKILGKFFFCNFSGHPSLVRPLGREGEWFTLSLMDTNPKHGHSSIA